MRQREEDLLTTLALKVRWLTFEQVAEGLDTSVVEARRVIGRLEIAGLVRRTAVRLPPVERRDEPLVRWRPGEPMPPYHRLATRLRVRWPGPRRPATIVRATRRGAHLVGGNPGVIQPAALAHDQQCAQLLLHLRRTRPADVADWLSEAEIAHLWHGRFTPDAVIVSDQGAPRLVLEIGGRYPVEHLLKFHRNLEERSMPAEIW